MLWMWFTQPAGLGNILFVMNIKSDPALARINPDADSPRSTIAYSTTPNYMESGHWHPAQHLELKSPLRVLAALNSARLVRQCICAVQYTPLSSSDCLREKHDLVYFLRGSLGGDRENTWHINCEVSGHVYMVATRCLICVNKYMHACSWDLRTSKLIWTLLDSGPWEERKKNLRHTHRYTLMTSIYYYIVQMHISWMRRVKRKQKKKKNTWPQPRQGPSRPAG